MRQHLLLHHCPVCQLHIDSPILCIIHAPLTGGSVKSSVNVAHRAMPTRFQIHEKDFIYIIHYLHHSHNAWMDRPNITTWKGDPNY
mmetsp:Transcript_23613/g.42590  ORF Transcript_23613/g.42590 Transcript_23613/m.42590 type:complete len:86 (+) Transcript_23613:1214-1471(+)